MSRWPIPNGWSWVKAADIATIVGGGTPSTKNPGNFTENGIPWITPADLSKYQNEYISRGLRDLSEEGYNSSGAQLMPKGTVLFTSRAPVGYCVLAANQICTNQGFKSLVLRGAINPKYIRHYLLYSKEYAESLASGSTFKELSGKRMATLEFPIPPLNEQKRIAAKIEELQARSRRAREALETVPDLLEQLRQSILAAAFRGDLTKQWREERSLPAPRPGAFFVYVLKCADDSNYIGMTENLQGRWDEHKLGKGGRWTEQNPPQYVLHWEEHLSRQAAAKREKWLKTGFGRKWLKREEKAGRLRQAGNAEPASELLKRIRVERRKRWESAELDKLKAKDLTGDKLDEAFAKKRKKYKEPIPVDTSDLPELPEGWCWAIVEELSLLVTKGSSPRWQGFEYTTTGVPFVRSQNVLSGSLDLAELAFLPKSFNKKERKSILAANDVLVNIVGASIGRAALATEDVAGGNVNQAVAVIRLIQEGILPSLLVDWLLSPRGQRQIHGGKVEVARANLSLTDVSTIIVPLPPFIEQEELVFQLCRNMKFLALLSDKIVEIQTSLDDLDHSALTKAFRGQLVPQNPNDEPASVLLERIREEKEQEAAKQKPKDRRRGRKMKKKKDKQKEVLVVLREASRALTPEEIFATGGFEEDSVDAFYEQLRKAVVSKQVREMREGDLIQLEAIGK